MDWITAKKSILTVLFYDPKQRVKSTYMLASEFDSFKSESDIIQFSLQLSVKGGNEYIKFINDLLANKKVKHSLNNYDLRVFNNYGDMENAIQEKNK